MVERHISMRGEVVDFNRLRMLHSDKPALGNANMNARGDIIDTSGTVIKTQEQIDAEWSARMEEQREITKTVDIKDPAQMPGGAKMPAKQLDVDDAAFDPGVTTKPRRRMIETDE